MIYTIAHLFKKDSLSRAEFCEYYESRHTHLARSTLPEFSYYRRNHVLESTDDTRCPDSFSEFGYDDESKLLETMAILGDARGQALMDDELNFMTKARNQIYPAQPQGTPLGAEKNIHKTVLVLRGAGNGAPAWRAAWQSLDPSQKNNMLWSEVGNDSDQQLHWLMGWSTQSVALAPLQQQLLARSVPVLWCARVDERIGYPQ